MTDKSVFSIEDAATEIILINRELTAAKAEIEQLRGRVAQLESAALNAISFMSGGQAKADLRDAHDAEVPATAWLLRKQAEAINQSINNYFNIDNSPHGLKDHLEWQAQRLRQQAD